MCSEAKKLAGRTILVTGGARRIGAAIVRALAHQGAEVVIHCHRSLSAARELADELTAQGRRIGVVQGDLGDPNTPDRLMDDVLAATGGRLDGLVNNASNYPEAHLLTVAPAAIEDAVRLHASAPLLLARRLAGLGVTGDVVNVLDARVTMYDAQHAAYHLSKRMLLALTSMLALELAPRIRVNAVAPGAVLAPDGQDADAWQRLAACNPLQRLGDTRGVADCVSFLMTCAFMTGQTLYYDGGYHLKAATYG